MDAFEEWIVTFKSNVRLKKYPIPNFDRSGDYISPETENYWVVWKGASMDRDDELKKILAACKIIVAEALYDVTVHPCDQHDNAVKSKFLSAPMKVIYDFLEST